LSEQKVIYLKVPSYCSLVPYQIHSPNFFKNENLYFCFAPINSSKPCNFLCGGGSLVLSLTFLFKAMAVTLFLASGQAGFAQGYVQICPPPELPDYNISIAPSCEITIYDIVIGRNLPKPV